MSRLPAVVTIGGLDPCGGAGIVADARAITAAGAWPAVVTAVQTVQSTTGLRAPAPAPATPSAITCCDTALLRAQLSLLLDDLDVRAFKTGALGGLAAARVVRALLPRVAGQALVVDPVMRPSRSEGAPTAALNLAGDHPVESTVMLADVTTLLTPNLPEAERLLGGTIDSSAQAAEAAQALRELGPQAVLLKGGHADPHGSNSDDRCADGEVLCDWLATSSGVTALQHRRLAVGQVHGTGCVLASLIAGRLALRPQTTVGDGDIVAAVQWAITLFQQWLATPIRVGRGMPVLAASPRQDAP